MSTQEDRERALKSALQAVAAEDAAGPGSSSEVRERLLADVRSIARAKRRRHFMLLGAAAVVALAVALPFWRTTPIPSPPQVTEVTTPFIPLIAGSWPAAAVQVVRIEVPRQALASFGLLGPEIAQPSGDTVLADVAIGNDGVARAVRFVQRTGQQERRQ